MSRDNSFMLSFTMPCSISDRNERMVKKACEVRHEELRDLAAKENQSCDFKYEVISSMDNIRVNLYSATTKDAMMIGYNFCALQMNPSLL